MPITVAEFNETNEQDQRDLTKIYQEDTCFQSPTDIQAHILNMSRSPEHSIFTARFNDRLLAAAVIQRHSNNQWQITKVNVRQITRRRRVAYELIRQLRHLALNEKQDLWLTLPPEYKPAAVLLEEIGFRYDNQRQIWLATKCSV